LNDPEHDVHSIPSPNLQNQPTTTGRSGPFIHALTNQRVLCMLLVYASL
jgi:hypothetical protein